VVAVGSVLLTLRIKSPAEGERTFPRISYGAESCSDCGMSIGDERFAAAWRDASGEERHFDDIGCMVSAYNRDGAGEAPRFYVHDYRKLTWLEATAASYVVGNAIKTPMAYGVVALEAYENAQELAENAPGMAARHWTDVVAGVERKS
jgi:copper chaperone NosL